MIISKSALLTVLFGSAVIVVTMTFIFNAVIKSFNQKHDFKSDTVFFAAEIPTRQERRTNIGSSAESADFREWYAAPDAKPSGDGTIKSPLDLATLLDAKASRGGRVKAGDTIWLRGGVYAGNFTSTIEGAKGLPIQVRGYEGERVILDKNSARRDTGTLDVRGAYVWFQDFEVTNSYADRKRLDGDGELNPWRGSNINVYAPNTKYINLVVRDGGHGFGLWNEEGGTEIYGCLIFNNGNNKKEHGVYAHNKTGTQTILDNIIFNGAGYGLHIYANSTKSSISGFDIEGNVIFNNGALTLNDQVADQILVGGVEGVPAARIRLRGNYIYNNPEAATAKNRGVRLGYRHKFNQDVKLFDNYIVSKVPLKILWWNSIEARGNTIYSPEGGANVEIETPPGVSDNAYTFESNIYLNARKRDSVFIINDKKEVFESWQESNFDRKGRVEQVSFSGGEGGGFAKIFVRQNKYERGRANVVVFNWSLNARVEADLSKILRVGDKYEVRDAQNYLGEPVLTGVYDGKPLQLPMNLSQTTKPTGGVERVPAHTDARFGAFVIRRVGKA